MENNRTLIDRLGTVSDATLRALREGGAAAAIAGGNPMLKFRPTDRVRDLATGLVGVVKVAGAPIAGGGQLYAVDLSDGRQVWRGSDELALDQAIAPAPEAPK